MRVYRHKYKAVDGSLRETSNYYVEFRDHRGAVRRLPAFKERKATAEFGRRLSKLIESLASGEGIDRETRKWIEKLPERIRDRLSKIGLLSGRTIAASKPLKEHIEDYRQALLDRSRTSNHALVQRNRCNAIVEGIGARFYSAIGAAAVQRYLAKRREDDDLSVQSCNHYLTALKAFCTWMVAEQRATESPIGHLSKANAKTDLKRIRRALDPDELVQLLDVTRESDESFGINGPDRALLYRFSAETGLRANETRSLTKASFELDGQEPSVTLEAAYSKNRTEAVQPLRRDTAQAIKMALACKTPDAHAFSVPIRTADMLKADLANARAKWIKDALTPIEGKQREQSGFLAYVDRSGRVADFHALRHTFISNLADAGVHPKDAQTLARHSTITLTMDVYTHSRRENLTSA